MSDEQLKEIESTVTIEFRYGGIWRTVDNIEFEDSTRTVIGMEVRKGGKFSWKVKRFSAGDMTDIRIVAPIERKGPKIDRPEKKKK